MRARKSTKNVDMLAVVAKGLKGLKEKVVFVGGATIDLFVVPGASETRATDDVDCVIELGTKGQYHQIEDELRKLGFEHPLGDERPQICRWKFSGIPVDVMPTEGQVLGFTNRWYRDGMAHSQSVTLPDGQQIEAFSVPYLLASKLEAFEGRGRGDYMGSSDIEDIVTLLDGCPDTENQVREAPADVRQYLTERFGKLLDADLFLLALDGNLKHGPRGADRVQRCRAILDRLAGRS